MKYADLVKAALTDAEARQQRVAAFFCESMLGCGGQIVLPDHYCLFLFDMKAIKEEVCFGKS